MQVHTQRIRVPELMFSPQNDGHEMASLPKTIQNVLNACPVDCRAKLLEGMLVFGGNAMWKPNGDDNAMHVRIMQEMENLGVSADLKCASVPDGNTCQIGGAQILASISKFKNVSITREQFDDNGAGRSVLKFCAF